MKKIFLLLFVLPVFVIAQPVINQANLPKMFDEIVYYSLNTCLYDLDSGELVVWDFSKCTHSDSVEYDYLKVPTAYTSKFPNATFTEKYTQYIYTNYNMLSAMGGEYKNWGYISSNSSFKAIYSDPRVVIKYPFKYLDKYNDNFTYKFTTPVDSGTATGYVYVRAVGTGKLKLPNSISYNNALMVVSNQYGKETPGDVFRSITYEWYVPEYINPIIIINQNFQFAGGEWHPTQPSVIYQKRPVKAPVGIVQIETKVDIKITPNPSNHEFSIFRSIDNPTSLMIYNNFGEVVFKNELKGKANKISTSQLPNGIYYLIIGGNQSQYHYKLVIQH